MNTSGGVQDLARLSAHDVASAVRDGSLTAVDIARAQLARLATDAGNAVVHADETATLADAARVDADPRGLPLAGVPFVVKDNIDVAGQVTAAGSRAHAGVPAAADALVVRRLRAAGAVLLGRGNMDELAMGASTQTSAYGPTRNPHDPRRSPGGSSGGSAAAVGASLATLSVGTDTGGSIREPASQCGVVGMAPSPGLVPMDGMLPFAPDLDRAGPLARTVPDAAVLLEVMSGRTLTPLPAVRRVAVIEELAGPRNRAEVLAAFAAWTARLEALGVEVVSVSMPDAPAALEAYMRLTSVAALDWLAPWLATGRAGEEVLRRHEVAREVLADDVALADAHAVRERLCAQARAALAVAPVLVSPTMPTTAPLLFGSISPEDLADPMAAPYTDCWTVVANLTGLPSLSVPAPVPDSSASVGAMLMGADGADGTLLSVAASVADEALGV